MRYRTYDGLGNVAAVFDRFTVFLATARYDAWGTIVASLGRVICAVGAEASYCDSLSAFPNFGYTDGEYDQMGC